MHIQRCGISRLACLIVLLAVVASSQTTEFKEGTYAVTAGDTRWAVKYESDKVTLTRNGEAVVVGIYKVTGNELEVTDEGGVMACGGGQKTGRYKWKMEGKRLIFEKLEDGCAGRASALTSLPWERQ